MDRRCFVAGGVASLMVLRGAAAKRPIRRGSERSPARPGRTDSARLFASGPLSDNPLAADFMTTPGLTFPDLVLYSEGGKHRPSELKGKLRLVTLWAEWCSSCLLVMPDLWQLQQRYGGPKFEILAILSGSMRNFDAAQARALLIRAGAGRMPLWIEPAGGDRLLKALAVSGGHTDLPCDLLVDSLGRIRGRPFGARMVTPVLDLKPGDVRDGKLTASGMAKVERAQAAQTGKPQHSEWATTDGDAFIKTLVGGALG